MKMQKYAQVKRTVYNDRAKTAENQKRPSLSPYLSRVVANLLDELGLLAVLGGQLCPELLHERVRGSAVVGAALRETIKLPLELVNPLLCDIGRSFLGFLNGLLEVAKEARLLRIPRGQVRVELLDPPAETLHLGRKLCQASILLVELLLEAIDLRLERVRNVHPGLHQCNLRKCEEHGEV